MSRQFRLGLFVFLGGFLSCAAVQAQEPSSPKSFNGLDMNLGSLSRLSDAKSRSISPENFTGEKGKAGMATEGTGKRPARELGQGWKVSPSVVIKAKSTFTVAEIDGSGAIQQIWMTPSPIDKPRLFILRFYWDGETEPSVEVPLGDFFACGWGKYCQINSLPVCVNPGSAFNSYWNMPFRKKAKITLENLDDKNMVLYYQVNYTLTDVPDDAAYFHAQFRRVPKLPAKSVYTILDGVTGRGQYVGTYMAWEVRSPRWWGEGEIKFFFDGDKEFPTICGTGTEDYFCGSYNFENRETRLYQTFSTPYAGLAQVLPPDVAYVPPQRFGLYRWHIVDPVRFEKEMKVTIQALGWKENGAYLPLEDDIASVAYWYQTEPHAKFPALPSKEDLTIKPRNVENPAAEQNAGASLIKRGLFVISEGPDKKVTSVSYCDMKKSEPVVPDEEILTETAKLYRLGTLNASGCKITDDQLRYFSGLKKLTSLVLDSTPITDAGLAHLRNLQSLESFLLSNTAVTDAGLEHIAKITNLKILDLSKTKVTDAGLKKLQPLSELKWLLLSDTDITDAGLGNLASMKSLLRLSVNKTKVTSEGVEKLKKALPDLKVDQ